MKKTIAGILVASLLVGCNGKQQSGTTESAVDSDSVAISDTAAVEPSVVEEEVKDDYIGDGHTFDVKGNVKKIDLYNSAGYMVSTVSFDSNEQYKPTDSYDLIKRNGDGQIVLNHFDDGGGYNIKYEYGTDGRVTRETLVWGLSRTDFLVDDGEVDEVVLQYGYEGGNVTSIRATYKYDKGNYVTITNPKSFTTDIKVEILSTDDKGNWTKRRLQGEIITIDASGFEYAGEGEIGKEYYQRKKINVVEKRKISYY